MSELRPSPLYAYKLFKSYGRWDSIDNDNLGDWIHIELFDLVVMQSKHTMSLYSTKILATERPVAKNFNKV